MKVIAIALAVSLASSHGALAQETKPIVLIPTENCPEYTNLLRRFVVLAWKKTGPLGCQRLYAEREYLLRSMLPYGENPSCYRPGWNSTEIVSFLQGVLNRNHAEMLRCQAWLNSGRVCEDGGVCPAGTICTKTRACEAKNSSSSADALRAARAGSPQKADSRP